MGRDAQRILIAHQVGVIRYPMHVPTEQTEVPLVCLDWTREQYSRALHIGGNCLKQLVGNVLGQH